MLTEASRCLEEGIVRDAGDVDMGLILGIGFPPFRGGILRADSRIWRPRPLAQQVLIYWAVLTLGPVLMSAEHLGDVCAGRGLVRPDQGNGAAAFHRAADRPFPDYDREHTFIYLLVPNRKVHFRHALAGSTMAGIMFEAM